MKVNFDGWSSKWDEVKKLGKIKKIYSFSDFLPTK